MPWALFLFLAGMTAAAAAPPVEGLDHIPIAVNDLDRAADTFQKLGFVIKPGRLHDDGILNRHVKFPDHTELELITAPRATDELTADYRRLLAAGNAPAFLGLRAPDYDVLTKRLDGARLPYERNSGLITFPAASPLHFLFFGSGGASPTDTPAYFAHANTAASLIGVWLALDDPAPVRHLLDVLGIPMTIERACTPRCADGPIARLPHGEIVFLPPSRQIVPGRSIVGAILSVRYPQAVAHGATGTIRRGRSAFVPPESATGLWLEFRGQN